MNLSDNLIMLTSKLMLVKSKKDAVELASEFSGCITRAIQIENESAPDASPLNSSVSATLKFTLKEISMSRMSKTFKKEFIANGLVTHIVKRPSGKRGFYYEIQYRRNGYYITASSKDIAEAKKKFLQKTEPEEIEKYRKRDRPIPSATLFEGVSEEWFLYKKNKLCAKTYANYYSYYQRFLYQPFHGRAIADIKTIELDQVFSKVENRVYEDLRIVANSIFKYANLCGLIQSNPVTLVPFKKAERFPRRALTKEEQYLLLENLEKPEYAPYRQCFLIMLYFGLRPCELQDARFEGNFLIARNAKRKGGKIEYKKIPICKQAREKLDIQDTAIVPHRTNVLNRIFKRIMGDENATQYYFRHTFATKCQEYVRPDIVDIWLGDSPKRLVGKVYTHFSDEFMQEQMDKVTFDI